MLTKLVYANKLSILALATAFLSLSATAQPIISIFNNPQALDLKERTLGRANLITKTAQFKQKFPENPTLPNNLVKKDRFEPWYLTTITLSTLVSTTALLLQSIRLGSGIDFLYSLVPATVGIAALSIFITESKKETELRKQIEHKKYQKSLEVRSAIIGLEMIRQGELVDNETHYDLGIRSAAKRLITSEAIMQSEILNDKVNKKRGVFKKLSFILKNTKEDENLVENLNTIATKLIKDLPLTQECRMISEAVDKPNSEQELRQKRANYYDTSNLEAE